VQAIYINLPLSWQAILKLNYKTTTHLLLRNILASSWRCQRGNVCSQSCEQPNSICTSQYARRILE